MSDPLQSDPLRARDEASEPDRDAKIEQLLLVGLDHYFAAEYEHAINVWTRALFLDRSHARARAYIERARSALAERQRESEELLQNGLAAFRRGEADEARRLVEAAMNRGAPRDEALAVLDRLSRLEQGAGAQRQAMARSAERSPLPLLHQGASTRRLGIIALVLAIVAIAAAGVYLSAGAAEWGSLFGVQPATSQLPPTAAVEFSLPMPLKGEIALTRARTLAAGGHLHDALAALDVVKPTDLQKAEADQLRATIQRQLIGLASTPVVAPGVPRAGGPLP